jgi:amidophosphoribosyltransferase
MIRREEMQEVLDRPKESCGIIGVYGHPEASEMAYLSLYALQHRGQEGAGIVSSDGNYIYKHIGQGLVNDVFVTPDIIEKLKGHIAIGHNRYSTTGMNQKINVQPILVNIKNGPLALGHNGNLVNSEFLRKMLEEKGSNFQTTTDSEIIVHLIARSGGVDLVKQIQNSLDQVYGAFSLVIMTKDKLIAVRDNHGFRPLALGKLDNSYIIASETCAMDLIGAEYIRDVEPGEIIIIDNNGMHSEQLLGKRTCNFCVFELIYFSRPDSRIFGENVDKARRKLGKRLAQESHVDADIVISVPDSSNTIALGYAHCSGIKFELGLIRNHYIGRTFIQPQQKIRHFNVKLKFNPIEGVFKDRKIIVVEDSIVRGTTLKVLTHLIRKAGAKEVHIRVGSPPIQNPCYYGMDFPDRNELIAASMSLKEIKKYLEVDSLKYLSLEGLIDSVPGESCSYCTACFDGSYPIPIDKMLKKNQYENQLEEVV